MPITSSKPVCHRLRFLKPKQQTTTAIVEAGSHGIEARFRIAEFALVESVVVLTVKVEVEVFDWSGTVNCEKLQETPAGKSEQASETAELNPLIPCTVTVAVPLFPAVNESDAGKIVIEKYGGMV
jgi:hypothetical protein